MSSDDTVFCINCGSSISADTNFCPECGSGQDPEDLRSKEQLNAGKESKAVEHDGFTAWAIGFQPGKTGRNILVGFAYFVFYYVGIPLLIYAYLDKNPDKSEYFAWAGGALLILMSFAAISQVTIWGMVAGGIGLLLGLFFLPLVRETLGVKNVPGIDVENSARRSVIVGSGYAIGSMVLIGSALPEAETDTSSDSGNSDGSSNDGSSSGETTSLEDKYPDYYAIHNPTDIVVLEANASADSTSVTVEGELVNESGEDYDYVQITFGLYDESGAKVGDALDNTSGLADGRRWRFSAISTGNNASTFELDSISAY